MFFHDTSISLYFSVTNYYILSGLKEKKRTAYISLFGKCKQCRRKGVEWKRRRPCLSPIPRISAPSWPVWPAREDYRILKTHAWLPVVACAPQYPSGVPFGDLRVPHGGCAFPRTGSCCSGQVPWRASVDGQGGDSCCRRLDLPGSHTFAPARLASPWMTPLAPAPRGTAATGPWRPPLPGDRSIRSRGAGLGLEQQEQSLRGCKVEASFIKTFYCGKIDVL